MALMFFRTEQNIVVFFTLWYKYLNTSFTTELNIEKHEHLLFEAPL